MVTNFPKDMSTEDCTDFIVNELNRTKLPDNFSLEISNPWGLQHSPKNFSQKLIFLKFKNDPIAVLEFYINHMYIEGTKEKNLQLL